MYENLIRSCHGQLSSESVLLIILRERQNSAVDWFSYYSIRFVSQQWLPIVIIILLLVCQRITNMNTENLDKRNNVKRKEESKHKPHAALKMVFLENCWNSEIRQAEEINKWINVWKRRNERKENAYTNA